MCLHLSGAPYLSNSSYIRQLTFRLYLVTEIRIVRQIKNKIDSEGNELNQCIRLKPFLFRFPLFTQCVFVRVSSLITRPMFLNSRFIHLTWCPCGLVTEIRIVRQINWYILKQSFYTPTWRPCSLVTEVRIVRQINCETVGAESSIIASKHDNFPFLSLALFTHYVFFCVSSGSSSLSVCSCGPFSSWNYVWLVRKNHCHGIIVSCTN